MKSDERFVESPLEPPLDFLQHLWRLNHALERASLRMERTLGVTAQQRLFVRCIGKYPGMTASQLATVLHLDRGTVSVGLRRLAKKGLLTRRRDPRDHRRVALGLTSKGRALDRPHPSTVEFAVKQVMTRVSSSDTKRVKAVLSSLAGALSEILEPGGKRRDR